MALNFNPGNFARRPDTGYESFQNMTQNVGNIGDILTQLKAKEDEKKRQQLMDSYLKSQEDRAQRLSDFQLGTNEMVPGQHYGVVGNTMGQFNEVRRPYQTSILESPLKGQFSQWKTKMVHKPGSLEREEAYKREDMRLKREENAANRDWTRQMALDKFGLQQETFGLKKELEEAKAEAARKAEENARQLKIREANDVISSIDKAIGKVGWSTTGLAGSFMDNFAGSGATDLAGDLSHINSLLGLGKLSEMKSQSKAGASGMGPLSEKEMDLLISAVQSLKQSQSPQQLRSNLEEVKLRYSNWLKMEEGINPYGNQSGGGQLPGGQGGSEVVVNSVDEINRLPKGTRFSFNGRKGTVQ